MIPAWQIPGFKAVAERTLTDSCTIERPYSAISDAGDVETGWNTVGTVRMRMLPEARRMPGDGQIGGREANRLYGRLILATGTDIRDGDRVLVGGVRWEVLRLDDRATDKTFVQADVARIDTV